MDTLTQPPTFACSEKTHEPFLINSEPLRFSHQDELLLMGLVRTVGAQFDGDRTDVHDIFAIVWAAVIRAFGLASPSLIYEEHPFAPGEIGACHVAFTQCPWRIGETNFNQARRSMIAWTAFEFHLLDDMFRWYRVTSGRMDNTLNQELIAPWIPAISKYLKDPDDLTLLKRRYPNWHYFSSRKKGVSIIRMSRTSITAFKDILSPFSPETARGVKTIALFANGIPNTIPYRTLERGKKLLSLVENNENKKILVLPIDSHCLFIGDRTIIAVKGEFGRHEFQKERELLLQRRERENRVFYAESKISWNTPLDAKIFENLCLELLQREPGVVRAKLVGDTNDRDGGRDIVIDWNIPIQHVENLHENVARYDAVSGGVETVQIIVQVKSRARTIGKHDVQDIRDTLEHYDADGFLLIAFPRISAALFDRLEKLRSNKSLLLIECWDSADLEQRLRRHPDIAKRHPGILKITV